MITPEELVFGLDIGTRNVVGLYTYFLFYRSYHNRILQNY